jgi:DtxR family Mn-dependent transcriptional regulator
VELEKELGRDESDEGMDKMTQSLEDYLKTIGLLTDRGEVRITDIAARLGVSKPSVVAAIRLLEEQGFLEHKRYRTVALTKQRKEKAAEIRGRYEFLLSFFQEVVGVSVETAKQNSCKMEHIISEETLKKMKTLKRGSGGPEAPRRGVAGQSPAVGVAEGRRTGAQGAAAP